MSDIPADYPTRLNLADIVERIERQQEETRTFVAEQRKLAAEAQTLASEARKLDRDRGLAPWQVTAIIAGSLGALAASLVSLAKSMGLF